MQDKANKEESSDILRYKCKSCRVGLTLRKSRTGYTAQMHGNAGRPHAWSNKSHLKSGAGFGLFPTVETFVVLEAVKYLLPKVRTVAPNKIERFVRDEMQKHFIVDLFMKELREQRPILYNEVKPTELQITCFIKSNSKAVKDALLQAMESEEDEDSAYETPPKELKQIKSVFKS